jgi:O-antigen ligase
MASTPIRLMASIPMRLIASFRSYLSNSYSRGRRFGGYFRQTWPWYITGICYVLLALLASLYGAIFSLGGGYIIAPFLAPLAALVMIAIWVMPDIRYPPVRMMRALLTALIISFLCWPDYIALVIPGFPWLTAMRLTGIPLIIVLAICTFGSKPFRRQMADIMQGDKAIVALFAFFIIYSGMSIFFSQSMGNSAAKYSVLFYTGFGMFFAGMYIFNTPGRVRIFSYYLYIIAMFSVAVGLYEVRAQHLPWAGQIPSFLAIEDPRIIELLRGSARAATGKYRVQSKFSTAIGLGEFFGIALPFMLHLVFTEKNKFLKLVVAASILPALYITFETDSRLAFTCFLSSILLYILYQSFRTWRDQKDNIFAPAIMIAYPAFLALVLVLAFFWRRLSGLIFGTGAQQFSTQSRHEQWMMGVPKILHQPWGHGIGNSSDVLGYFAPGSTEPTVDSFYLTVLLDIGIIGFAAFAALFVWAIARAGYVALATRDRDTMFLAAASVALFNFFLGKSVYSQLENHPLAFLVLGMVVALLRRYKAETGQLPPPPSEADLYPPDTTDYVKDWRRRPSWPA